MFIVFLFQIVQSFDAEKLLTNEKFKQITRVTWLRGNSESEEDDSYLTFSEKTEIQIKLPPFYNLSTIIPTLDDCFYSKSSLSPSLRLLAIPCEFSSIFRVSYTAKFAFYDLFTQKYIEIKMPKGQSYRFQHFKWIGRHESFIFIKDNNIFYANSFDKYPEQLTFDGEPNRIFNGVPDWVYEEEIYMQRDTVLADPNGEKIIFIKIDDSEIKGTLVPEFDKSQPYDQVFQTVEYPKVGVKINIQAGQKIPRVNLMLLYLKAKRKSVKRQAIELLPPHRFRGSGKILSFFSFVISDEIVACWMNRLQDEIYMMKYKLKSVGSKMILREEIIFKASVQSWIEDKTFGDVHYSAKFDHLFFLWPFEQVDGDKYMHIMALDWSNPTEFLGITSGKWEVYNIICLNENYIYYISNEQGVGTRHLYALNLESNVQKCLTCDFPKDECDVVDVKTNNNCNKAHIICQAQDVSFSFIRIFEKDDKFGYKDIDLNDKTVPTPENPTLFKNRLFTLRYENGSPVDVYEQIPILNQSDDVKTDFLINM
ncbi:Inactive dipeptidyl peptidase 10 [Thelohanellus kitauei]|uniref:Inactive dipeptidyl peptidase 10 n=1 Tax=Thelohanellus kitauei TaxID=669202 RepID=A0A0C2M2Y8_THEKT|nr:Inactive dipeptidyl peptidase 10 [Thelohanellus kitauei]